MITKEAYRLIVKIEKGHFGDERFINAFKPHGSYEWWLYSDKLGPLFEDARWKSAVEGIQEEMKRNAEAVPDRRG